MTEAAFLAAVVELARLQGWRVHHGRPGLNRSGQWSTPITGDPGFPDLVLVGHGRLLLRELKSERGRVSAAQVEWLVALRHAGVDAAIWRPADWPIIEKTLARHAKGDAHDRSR